MNDEHGTEIDFMTEFCIEPDTKIATVSNKPFSIPATVRAGTDSLLIQNETWDKTTTMIRGIYVWMR